MSQTFLTKSGRKGVDLEPIALIGHDEVLTRGRRSTKEGGALLTKQGKAVAQLQRCYGSRQIIAELTHYLPILKYKPGALPGSLALHQARQNGRWPNILEEYWQALILRYKANDANRQLVDFLLWAKDFDLREIEDLIAKAMGLGCYQLESIKTLMRQQQYQEQVEPLGAELLGSLKCYDRPKLGTAGYNALLTGGAV